MSQQTKINKEQKYYVTMTDGFFSGWGKAEGKINKYVIECDNWQEAQIVKRNALNRSEMHYVRISYSKPKYNKENYEVTFTNKTNSPRFFQAGAYSIRRELEE